MHDATCGPSPPSRRVAAMALLRAVLDGCSTTGRSLLPAIRSLCGVGGQAALLRQERGFKKSTRKVEICLLQVSEKKNEKFLPLYERALPKTSVHARAIASPIRRLHVHFLPHRLRVPCFVCSPGVLNRGTPSVVAAIIEAIE